jgi:hypothetical protein
MEKRIIHCANIVPYLGSAIALPMITQTHKQFSGENIEMPLILRLEHVS